MIDERRYVLINEIEVTQAMRDNTIPYGINPGRRIVNLGGNLKELLKWSGDKPPELWGEYPVYSAQEVIDIMKEDLNKSTNLP